LTVMGGSKKPWYLDGGIPLANCIAVYEAIGASSEENSYINLANPGTYNLSALDVNKPTHDPADGWTFIGGNNQLTTGVQVEATWTIICRFSNVVSGSIFGATGTVGFIACFPSAGDKVYYYNKNEVIKAPGLSSGTLAIAGTKGYRNGVEDITTLDGLYNPDSNLTIGGILANNDYTGKIQAFAIYNIALSATQIALLHTKMSLLP